MYVETIYKSHCPKCGKANYVSGGDTSDLTGYDVDGVKCWSCRYQYLLDESESGGLPDSFFYEEGVPKEELE